MGRHSQDNDPLDEALKPPPDETLEAREARLAEEDQAKRVSQAIDESIKAERQIMKKRKVVRLLLLGQSESGKSTTLRHFQRLYTPTAFREERVLWRAVIQLNLVRSIRTITDALSDHRRPSVDSGGDDSEDELQGIPREIELLTVRLSPLRHIEALLIEKLVPPNEEEATHLGHKGKSNCSISSGSDRSFQAQEVFVRGATSWKGVLAKGVSRLHGRPNSAGIMGLDTRDEPQEVLHMCRKDIKTLWSDPFVREILRRRKIRLEEFPGFFLNDLDRVASLTYIPNDDDVLKARLKTVGVSEYRFEMEAAAGRESGTEWRIVDVGGSRSQRATWVPFFDDVDAIIFMAPISGFDQVLAKDRSVNRLEDSVLLWKAVCSNKLLANVDLVLFLNKCDILDAKLRAGIRLAKYVRTFGDRPNDLDSASKSLRRLSDFRSKFGAIHREYSPNPRKFYGWCTSVTDTATTGGILASVRDMVIRQHLKQSRLL